MSTLSKKDNTSGIFDVSLQNTLKAPSKYGQHLQWKSGSWLYCREKEGYVPIFHNCCQYQDWIERDYIHVYKNYFFLFPILPRLCTYFVFQTLCIQFLNSIHNSDHNIKIGGRERDYRTCIFF